MNGNNYLVSKASFKTFFLLIRLPICNNIIHLKPKPVPNQPCTAKGNLRAPDQLFRKPGPLTQSAWLNPGPVHSKKNVDKKFHKRMNIHLSSTPE
jgi:hypothetical protein